MVCFSMIVDSETWENIKKEGTKYQANALLAEETIWETYIWIKPREVARMSACTLRCSNLKLET